MTTSLTPIDPATAAARLKAGQATLVDIREPDEHAREHIAGAICLPLSRLEQGEGAPPAGETIFHCRSGQRTGANADRLAECAKGPAFVLEGGLDAWKRAGLEVRTNARAPLELNRQVQIAVGALMLIGVALAMTVHVAFIALPALLGCGLLFAGLSGWCGMARVLALAPWNRRPA